MQSFRNLKCVLGIQLAILSAAMSGCGKSGGESGAVKAQRLGLLAALDAIVKAPSADAGAPCERAGLTFSTNKPKVDGNAEVVRYFTRNVPGKLGPEIWSDAQDVGPLGYLASLSESASAGAKAPFLGRAGATKSVVVVAQPFGANSANIFLVDLPAGTIACKTDVPARARELQPLPYDPATGKRFDKSHTYDDYIRNDFTARLDKELATRFGVLSASAASASATQTAMRERFAKMSSALAVKPASEFPACNGNFPDGTLMATTLQLGVYAGAPPLARDDLNVQAELTEFNSSALLDLVDDTKKDQRNDLYATVARAPEFDVLDIPSGRLASFSMLNGGAESESFTPGAISARIVRFAPDGSALCQYKFEFVNPNNLEITYDAGQNTIASKVEATNAASIADFKAQLRAALRAPEGKAK